MDDRRRRSGRPFRSDIECWRAVAGGTHPDGRPVTEPADLIEASLICNLLERFSGYRLGDLLEEDAVLVKYVQIDGLGRPDPPEGGV
jgi:hypothetical protein